MLFLMSNALTWSVAAFVSACAGCFTVNISVDSAPYSNADLILCEILAMNYLRISAHSEFKMNS